MENNSYNGNSNLKPAGFEMQFTSEQVKELMKCKEDPVYFIENYCYIVSLDRGLILFNLYDCQKEKVEVIMNNRKVILMEGRQQGKTITSAACILHYTIFNSNKTVAILANKSTAAREVLSRYQIMYENLPLWMQQGIKTWNKGDVELENGSKVFTSATSASGIRGKSVNWLYIDEAAIIPNNIAEEFFTSTYPTIMAGETTKVLLTSTPLGYNHFWKYWNDATEGRNGFVALQIPYWKIPGRDEKWAADQKSVLGELKFNQEVLCTFLGSSNTLIAADTIARLSPIPFMHEKDGLDVLEYPVEGHVYFTTVDTSRGVGGDYSAFTVIDTTEFPYKIVAKYRNNKISPLLYPTVVHKVSKDYNNAYVLVEINDIGQQVADIIHNDLEYENMIWVGTDTRYGQVLSSSGRSSVLGVRTTKQVKRIGCATLKSLVEENKLLVFDRDIISEFSTFIEHNGVFQADEGYHDDLTMTLVLFAWATNDPMFKDLMNANNRQALYSSQMKSIEDELTPFGFIDNGQFDEPDVEVIDGDVWLNDKYQKDYSNFLKESRWN
ncbi:large terminase protein [uncultured Caudovirales phage]|uniref:Large terminase protein n=1 Tax=uncultured Caudovirales phage TaxID=2100421 RepID=A0A6J7X3U6_9CAUD|nr:large terminase protein [uncultured Caudovirales phage]